MLVRLRISLSAGPVLLLVLIALEPLARADSLGRGQVIANSVGHAAPNMATVFGGFLGNVEPVTKYEPKDLAGTSYRYAVNSANVDLLDKDKKPMFCGAAFTCDSFEGSGEKIACLNQRVPGRRELHAADLRKYAETDVDLQKIGGAMKVNICEVADRRGLRSLLTNTKTWQLNNSMVVSVRTPKDDPFGRICTIEGIPGFSKSGDCRAIYVSTKGLECYRFQSYVRTFQFRDWNAPEEKEIASLAQKIYGRTAALGSLVGKNDCRDFPAYVKFDDDRALLKVMAGGSSTGSAGNGSSTPQRAYVAGTTPR